MFPSLNTYAFTVALGLIPLVCVLARGGAEPATEPTSIAGTPAPVSEAPLDCRSARAALESELEALRQSCDVAVREFEACRAARPEWRDVELFSCSFEMSTSLTRGDVADPASIEDCGSPNSSEHDLRANCPVPDCEAELEALEETAAREAC